MLTNNIAGLSQSAVFLSLGQEMQQVGRKKLASLPQSNNKQSQE